VTVNLLPSASDYVGVKCVGLCIQDDPKATWHCVRVASSDRRLLRYSVYSYVYIAVRPYRHACESVLKKAAGCFSEMVVLI
jgi:hypothetical protein